MTGKSKLAEELFGLADGVSGAAKGRLCDCWFKGECCRDTGGRGWVRFAGCRGGGGLEFADEEAFGAANG